MVEDATIGSGEEVAVQWRSVGADRCWLRWSTDDSAEEIKEQGSFVEVGKNGEARRTLTKTTVLTFRCDAGGESAWSDLRVHVRAPSAPLLRPQKPKTIPVGFAVSAGAGASTNFGTIVAPTFDFDSSLDLSAALKNPRAAAMLSVRAEPDLGVGHVVSKLGWRIGTPYVATLVQSPSGATLAYAGVGARLALTLGSAGLQDRQDRFVELALSATSGPVLGATWQPKLLLAMGLASTGQLALRWHPMRLLSIGVFAALFASATIDVSAEAITPTVAGFPSVGIEVLLGL